MAAIRRKKKNNNGAHKVSKYTIIKRLEQAGKFEEAINILKNNELLYQKWLSVQELRSDDENAINLFTDIGLNPDKMLSR